MFFSVKFKYCEKPQKFEENIPLVLTFTQQRQEKWEVVLGFLRILGHFIQTIWKVI